MGIKMYASRTPMKDTLLDYTWRTNGKEVLICPECKQNGTPRRTDDDRIIMLHKEVLSDFSGAHMVEYCETSNDEINATLVRKEKARVAAYERMERLRAEKLARKSARHKKFLQENYGQSIVEMTLLMPIFCLLLFGTLDLARYIRLQVELNHAANVGLTVAQQSYSCPSTCTVAQETPVTQDTVTAAIQAADPQATVVPQYPANATVVPNATYVVVAKSNYSPITPFVRTLKGATHITAVSSGVTLP